MVSDTVGDINCAVVPDRAIMCYPFRWRVAIIQMLQPATKHSTHSVCQRWRANQKWANMRRETRERQTREGQTGGLPMMGGRTPGVGSAMGVGYTVGVGLTLGVGSDVGVGSAAGVGSSTGVGMDKSGVKGSGCLEGPSCPEGPRCPGGPEVGGFSGVGPGVSAVLILFPRLFLAHSSRMCISAHQTASSRCWPSKPLLLPLLAPPFNAPQNCAHMENPKITLSVTVQKSADPEGFCFVLPATRHSKSRNRSSACLQAASHCAVTSADGIWTTSYNDVMFTVGSVRCVVF